MTLRRTTTASLLMLCADHAAMAMLWPCANYVMLPHPQWPVPMIYARIARDHHANLAQIIGTATGHRTGYRLGPSAR